MFEINNRKLSCKGPVRTGGLCAEVTSIGVYNMEKPTISSQSRPCPVKKPSIHENIIQHEGDHDSHG